MNCSTVPARLNCTASETPEACLKRRLILGGHRRITAHTHFQWHLVPAGSVISIVCLVSLPQGYAVKYHLPWRQVSKHRREGALLGRGDGRQLLRDWTRSAERTRSSVKHQNYARYGL